MYCKVNKKYTAIYEDWWMAGSHRYSLIKFKYITKKKKETVSQMLEREGILNETQYLFLGHPKLQGEENSEIQ